MADISTNEIEATSSYGVGDFMNGLFGAYTTVEVEKAKAKAASSQNASNTANPNNTITDAVQTRQVASGVSTAGLTQEQIIQYSSIGAVVLFIIVFVVWGFRKGGKR
jgi:hypothetical protein